jgi:hypothetical protein
MELSHQLLHTVHHLRHRLPLRLRLRGLLFRRRGRRVFLRVRVPRPLARGNRHHVHLGRHTVEEQGLAPDTGRGSAESGQHVFDARRKGYQQEAGGARAGAHDAGECAGYGGGYDGVGGEAGGVGAGDGRTS